MGPYRHFSFRRLLGGSATELRISTGLSGRSVHDDGLQLRHRCMRCLPSRYVARCYFNFLYLCKLFASDHNPTQKFTPFPPTKFQAPTAKMSLGTQLSAWIARAGHVMPDTTHVAHTTARTIARPTPRHKMQSAICNTAGFHVSANP